MKTIKINAEGAGKWADPDTNIPQIIVEEGDEVTVSNALADMMLPNCGKDITADVAKIADDEAAEQKEKDEAAAEEVKVEALTAEVLTLVEALGLDPKDTNTGLDSKGLQAVVDSLTEQQETKIAEALAAAEKAEAKKIADAKKTPATKDKAKAEPK